MLRARSRSNCWLPPQPWMNSTPGIRVAGARNVPDRSCPSTLMVTGWLLVAMAHHSRGLAYAAHKGVIVVVDQQGLCRLAGACAIAFRRPGAHPRQAGIRAESLKRAGFAHAGPAGPPRLFQHAIAILALRIAAAGHVVIAA